MKTTSPGSVIHTLLDCDSVMKLLEESRNAVSNPIVLCDLSLHILAITQEQSISDPRWHSLCDQNLMPMNLLNISLYRSALRTGAPVLSTDSTGLPVVRCAVAQEGRLIGYLLSPCYSGPPAQEELDILQVTADLCSVRMQKEMHYAEYPENMTEYFISDLLNGTITDEQKIRDRCRYFGWHLRMPYRILSIRSVDEREMETGEGYLEQSRRCDLLRKRFPDATIFLYGEQIKLILGIYDENTREQLVLRDVREFLQKNGMVAGVSQPGRNFRGLSARHRQAMKALQMGSLLKGSGPLFYYDHYSVYHALELCSGGVDLRELCHDAVLKLEQYDRKNGTALMGTLHAYLACGKNVSEAASALFIHRNTLAKRLERINDMIQIDLEDRETVFHLLFSFRVMEYYGATQMRNTFENWVEKMPTLRHL